MYQLTCSIVLYENNPEVLKKAIESVLQSRLNIKLFLIDNSGTDQLKNLAFSNAVDYTFNNKNIGFGNAHNTALEKARANAPYHLILNPDIEFHEDVLENIYNFMEKHKDVGQLMPKVFYDNGNLQKLCHLIPAPVNLVSRRFFENYHFSKKINDRYELEGFNYNTCANIPNLSGCFMFMRNSVLEKVGGFDTRFFMYMEDIDLTRRMHKVSQTLFYPEVSIYHKYEKGSYSNSKLLKHHINSAIKYFNKWGWFFDEERSRVNNETLHRLNLPK